MCERAFVCLHLGDGEGAEFGTRARKKEGKVLTELAPANDDYMARVLVRVHLATILFVARVVSTRVEVSTESHRVKSGKLTSVGILAVPKSCTKRRKGTGQY